MEWVAGDIGNLDAAEDRELRRRRWIAGWLFTVAVMVFLMVVLGGVTRLTHSGLSMVEWKPVTGWLPPFTEAEWQAAFGKYQQYPEFQKLNSDMTLPEFKGIFWFEFTHRLWGRLIGVAFAVPFAFFALRRWMSGSLVLKCALLLGLGALQGGLGWYMVKSGLVDRPDVSQYRLAAHLGLAVLIFGYLIWVALDVLAPRRRTHLHGPARGAAFLLVLLFVTILSGALVAGLDAGLTYNTFPLMDGHWVPPGYADLTPWYLNMFENIPAVQFDHRLLAMVTFTVIIVLWWRVRTERGVAGGRCAVTWLALMAVVQVGLGISTLLLVVPVSLAALHQAGAVVLFGLAVWSLRALSEPVS